MTSRITGEQILNQYQIQWDTVAKWIINDQIQIVGVLDDPEYKTAPEKEIHLLLKSRNDLTTYVNSGSGASFNDIDKIPKIEGKIKGIIQALIFDRDSFEEVHLVDNTPVATRQPEAKEDSPESVPDIKTMQSVVGHSAARSRWAQVDSLISKATDTALKLWNEGDIKMHNEMADHLLAMEEYSTLIRYKKRLMKSLLPESMNFGLARGVKGSKKHKN